MTEHVRPPHVCAKCGLQTEARSTMLKHYALWPTHNPDTVPEDALPEDAMGYIYHCGYRTCQFRTSSPELMHRHSATHSDDLVDSMEKNDLLASLLTETRRTNTLLTQLLATLRGRV